MIKKGLINAGGDGCWHWPSFKKGIPAKIATASLQNNSQRLNDEQYQKYFDHFNPDLFNPEEWDRTAKMAGQIENFKLLKRNSRSLQ